MSTKAALRGGKLFESRRLGFLLKDTTRLYIQRFERHAGSLGLTLAQCRALIRLAESEGVSQTRLAELAELEPMTLVRILDRMESEGWIERRRSAKDRRMHCLFLTAKAKPLLESIRRVMDKTSSEALAGVPKHQTELLIELIDAVRTNLAEPDPSTVTDESPRGAAGAHGGG
jgi:DNA-binding MarR family transcriptional regulator